MNNKKRQKQNWSIDKRCYLVETELFLMTAQNWKMSKMYKTSNDMILICA